MAGGPRKRSPRCKPCSRRSRGAPPHTDASVLTTARRASRRRRPSTGGERGADGGKGDRVKAADPGNWFRISVATALVLSGGVAVVALHLVTAPAGRPTEPPSVTPSPGVPWFVDVTAASGIGFRHFDPATPQHNILETMGSGLAWIDYDNDGWPDLFCVQDGPLQPTPRDGPLPTNKLYRNNGDGTFTDVTEAAGLARAGFGMGCAVGDFDNDGFDDLVVTYWKGVVLYHNEPDGQGGRRFVDVTATAGLANPHWATSCGWGDVDGDGYLDLYVCNYAEVDLAKYPRCE